MAGLVPAIHVFRNWGRRGYPRQARAWRAVLFGAP